MAQLRQDYESFLAQDSIILVVGPEGPSAFQEYWSKYDLPFTGLPDPDHRVANLYGQQVKLLRAGRLPAMMVIDKSGKIRFQHYADTMRDIPPNQDILELLSRLNEEDQVASSSAVNYA